MLVINIAPISILGFDPTIPSCLCWMAGFQGSACSWDETPVMLPAAKGPRGASPNHIRGELDHL